MNKLQSSVPFLILAFLCGLASFGIAFTAFVAMANRTISDTGMLAIAGMTFAPAVMGIGIAQYLPRDQP
jgi:hypothetical protein